MALERIRVGSSYYPPHHSPEEWVTDLDRMREAGLDTIRTAELLASWDRIELDRDVYDFSWLDRIFDLAEERGIGILLGTGTNCPPIWMLDRYPDLQVVSSEGIPYTTATAWSWACKDNPGMKLENEPGFPFIARHGASMDTYCFCHHTEEEFRHWLRQRYETPDALSDAWRWD